MSTAEQQAVELLTRLKDEKMLQERVQSADRRQLISMIRQHYGEEAYLDLQDRLSDEMHGFFN